MSQPRVLQDIANLESQNVIHTQRILSLQESITDIESKMQTAVSPVAVSTLAVGDEFYLYESGILTPFILVDKDYPTGEGNSIAMRKHPLPPDYIGAGIPMYLDSHIDDYLTNTYKNVLGAQYSDFMLESASSNGNSMGDDRSVFLASYKEITGRTRTIGNNTIDEGEQFEYFTLGNSPICTLNGTGINYYLRTFYDISTVCIITGSGNLSFSSPIDDQYIRPFISITGNVYRKIFNDTSNVLATAVVTG